MALLRSKLTILADQINPIVEGELDRTATLILSYIRQFSPVDTGLLRASYFIHKVSESHIDIGTQVNYGKYQEFGFIHYRSKKHVAAQPHLSPAFVLGSIDLEPRLKNAIVTGGTKMFGGTTRIVGNQERQDFIDPFGEG